MTSLKRSLSELFVGSPRRFAVLMACVLVAAAVPIAFTVHTNLIWEDFFITYRYSENLARGHGLVFSPGERVHGFTSPLNTLLPALFAFVLRARDFAGPLLLYRAVSLACLLFGIAAAAGILMRDEKGSGIRFFFGAVFPLIAVLEIKTTAFTMSGQEAGLMIGFLAPAFAAACAGWTRHAVFGGLMCAGLMYTRPDGFIYAGAIAIAALAFEAGPRLPLLRAFWKSALICAVLYLPWFVFAWAYYGSPIPHTITAKNGVHVYSSEVFGLLTPFAAGLQEFAQVLCRVLAAIYDPLTVTEASWPKWLHDGIASLELVAIFYWVAPGRDRVGRMASLAVFFMFCYMVYANLVAQYSPWYYPPLAFMSLFVLTSAISTWAGLISHRVLAFGVAGLGLSVVFFFLGYLFLESLLPLRVKQEVIEWNHRRVIGLWLKEHVPQGESVYVEPLGYFGYFSQCRMLDWPGLVSPAVVEARRQIGYTNDYTWAAVAEKIKPDWIVARPPEAESMAKQPYLSKHYVVQKVFDARKPIGAIGNHPGIVITYWEMVFIVYRRKD